jgi:hypothetical protein
MAYCPECNGELAATATACSHCGYDFHRTDQAALEKRRGFAYSTLADLALLVSMIAAAIGAFLAVLGALVSLYYGQWFNGLVLGPIAFFLQLGMLVVFLRMIDTEYRGNRP